MNKLWWALEILLHLKCIKLILHLLAYMTNGLQLLSFKINQPNMFYLQCISILAYFLCHLYAFPMHYLLLRLETNIYFSVKPWCFFHGTIKALLEGTSGGHLVPPPTWNKITANVWVGNVWLFLAEYRKMS